MEILSVDCQIQRQIKGTMVNYKKMNNHDGTEGHSSEKLFKTIQTEISTKYAG